MHKDSASLSSSREISIWVFLSVPIVHDSPLAQLSAPLQVLHMRFAHPVRVRALSRSQRLYEENTCFFSRELQLPNRRRSDDDGETHEANSRHPEVVSTAD